MGHVRSDENLKKKAQRQKQTAERRPAGAAQTPERSPAARGSEELPGGAGSSAVRKRTGREPIPETGPAKPGRYYDLPLFAAAILLTGIGLLMIYSSSQYIAMLGGRPANFYFLRQLLFSGVGIAVALVISKIDYKLLIRIGALCILVAFVLQLLTLLIGNEKNGSVRWIEIAGIQFQPAELSKAALIIYTASMISKYGYAISNPRRALHVFGTALFPIALITRENLSTGIITGGIVVIMLFVAMRQWKGFLICGGIGIAGLLAAKPLIRVFAEGNEWQRSVNYHINRLYGWAAPEHFPDDAYQTKQGLYAIGSGGLFGKGLGGSIIKFAALPETHNDMIFSIICEELGLIRAAAIVLLFVFIVYRLMVIAGNSRDLFGAMLCTGVAAHVGLQVILNIAVVAGAIPYTGVVLPFMSYGGTAILCMWGEIGLALSVSNRINTEPRIQEAQRGRS